MILKTNFKIALLFFLFINCNGQSKSSKVHEKQQQSFNLLGNWKLIKRLSQDEKAPLSQKESLECAGNITTFKINSFVSPKDKCFGGYVCSSPNYKIQKVNAYEYFENDSTFLELLGITKKYIEVITSGCGVPFNSIIILDENNICYGMDGYEYFLERVSVTSKLKKMDAINNPVIGDTVRCLVREKNTCSGFVIQGTRKSGKALHVKPMNKDVPMEVR